MTIIGNRLLHADRNLCFVVKYFLLVAFCQMIGNNDPFNCFSYAPINIKPRKGWGGGGCGLGWGFVSVTRKFCKTPMRQSKNRQIKFKVPTPGTQNTPKNRYRNTDITVKSAGTT